MTDDLPTVDGKIVLHVPVPERTRIERMYGVPEAYAVEVDDVDPIPGGCVIWGKYRGKWEANASPRWLVRWLMERATLDEH